MSMSLALPQGKVQGKGKTGAARVSLLAGAPQGKKQDKGKGKDAGPAKEYVFTAESQAIDPTSPAGTWVQEWGGL